MNSYLQTTAANSALNWISLYGYKKNIKNKTRNWKRKHFSEYNQKNQRKFRNSQHSLKMTQNSKYPNKRTSRGDAPENYYEYYKLNGIESHVKTRRKKKQIREKNPCSKNDTFLMDFTATSSDDNASTVTVLIVVVACSKNIPHFAVQLRCILHCYTIWGIISSWMERVVENQFAG